MKFPPFAPLAAPFAPGLLCLLLAACGGGSDPLNNAPSDTTSDSTSTDTSPIKALAVTGTTSICVTKTNVNKTLRVDGVNVLSGSSNITNSNKFYVVPSGASITGNTAISGYFVEGGGLVNYKTGNQNVFMVAPAGRVEVDLAQVGGAGGSHKASVQNQGTLNCNGRFAGTILYENGAIGPSCANASNITAINLEPTWHFKRCNVGTVTNEIYPTANTKVSRSGQTLTITNLSSGTYTNWRWTISVTEMNPFKSPPYPKTVLYSGTVNANKSGFVYTLPAGFDTKYPITTSSTNIYDPGKYTRSVTFSYVDPFDRNLSTTTFF